MTILPIQASTTQTGAFTGSGVDVSAITGDWTLKFHIQALTAGSLLRLTAEDSVNSFTASISGPSISLVGALAKENDVVLSFKKKDYPDLRLGVANALLRTKVASLHAGGSGDSVTYDAWVEY